MRATAVVAGLLLARAVTLPGQRAWVEPKAPCNVVAGHFRITSAVLDLKIASEQPVQRDRMLRQALDVLTRAIRDDKQDKNPGAWYYFGRYYILMEDAAGADSSFDRAEALAPQCKAEIDGYRAELAGAVANQGLTLWQAGNADSASRLLHQAYALAPTNPKPLFQLGSLYVERNQLDSADVVLRTAVQAAGTDTAYAAARREAQNTIARLAFRRVQADPLVQQWQRIRYSRDSILPYLASDSSIFARMRASSASRRSRGARLSPADQQTFSRDSTARAEAVNRGRAAYEEIRQRAAADSVAAQAAYEPAIAAYRDLVAAFPTQAEAATTLASIYSQAGRRAEATAVFDALLTHGAELSRTELYDLGQRLVLSKLYAPGIKAYTMALHQNPFYRDALAELANAYVVVQDSANAVATAKRLVAIDPMNKSTLRLAGQAWELAGRRDSAQRYTTLADTSSLDVSIASVVGDNTGVTVTGIATNMGNTTARPLTIAVELLDAQGTVRATQPVEIQALAAGGTQQFEVKGSGPGIVGWRYRRS
jgi:tetratricopeptide (TPR) repeat protein